MFGLHFPERLISWLRPERLSKSFNSFFAASEPDENLVESASPDYIEATARSDGESAFIIVRNYATDCSADEQASLKRIPSIWLEM